MKQPLSIVPCILLALAPFAAGQDLKKDPGDGKKGANHEYFHPLRGDVLTQPGFELFGPRASEQIFF